MQTSTTITTTIISDNEVIEDLIKWAAIVATLHTKTPMAKLAKKIGCSEKLLSNLKAGYTKEPKFSTGTLLLAIHGRDFPETHAEMFGDS